MTPDGINDAGTDRSKGREQDATLPKDLIFELLKSSRRRELLEFLDRNDGRTTLSDAAEHIAAEENGIDVPQLSSQERKRVYIALYQIHLPKLDDAGVVDYEKGRGGIELRDAADDLFPYLYLDPADATDLVEDGDLDDDGRLRKLNAKLEALLPADRS